MIKKAVVLAAGKGSRLKSDCSDKDVLLLPKPLVPVNSKPLVSYCLSSLKNHSVETGVVINPVYRNLFEDMLSEFNVTFIDAPFSKGTASSLFAAKDFVSEDLFLVLMGDNIILDDFESLVDISEPTIFGSYVEDLASFGSLNVKEGKLYHIAEKTERGPGLANAGVYVLPKKFFSVYDEVPVSSVGELFLTDGLNILHDKYDFNFDVRILESWFSVNTFSDLSYVRSVLSSDS